MLAQKVQGSETRRYHRFRRLSEGVDLNTGAPGAGAGDTGALTWPPPKSRRLPLRYPFPSSYSVPDLTQLLANTEGKHLWLDLHCIEATDKGI